MDTELLQPETPPESLADGDEHHVEEIEETAALTQEPVDAGLDSYSSVLLSTVATRSPPIGEPGEKILLDRISMESASTHVDVDAIEVLGSAQAVANALCDVAGLVFASPQRYVDTCHMLGDKWGSCRECLLACLLTCGNVICSCLRVISHALQLSLLEMLSGSPSCVSRLDMGSYNSPVSLAYRSWSCVCRSHRAAVCGWCGHRMLILAGNQALAPSDLSKVTDRLSSAEFHRRVPLF